MKIIVNKINLSLFVAMSSLLLKSQTPIDSLNVTLNPFQKRTQAVYYLANTDTTTLYVFDALGQNILTVYSNVLKSSGHYQDSVMMDNFPDGVYFLSLKTKHGATNRKILKTASANKVKTYELTQFNIYPNPVKDILYLECEESGLITLRIEILNNLGNLLYQYKESFNSKPEIDLRSLKEGIYFLKVYDSESYHYFKIVKSAS